MNKQEFYIYSIRSVSELSWNYFYNVIPQIVFLIHITDVIVPLHPPLYRCQRLGNLVVYSASNPTHALNKRPTNLNRNFVICDIFLVYQVSVNFVSFNWNWKCLLLSPAVAITLIFIAIYSDLLFLTRTNKVRLFFVL